MPNLFSLRCPWCESVLNQETAPPEEGYVGFEGYKLLKCPCCSFFVDNSPSHGGNWLDLAVKAEQCGARRRRRKWLILRKSRSVQIVKS